MWRGDLSLIIFFLIQSFLPTTKGDIPVHCLHKEAIGKWSFKISEGSVSSQRELLNEDPTRLSCGHHYPDHPSTMYENQYSYDDNEGFPVASILNIELQNPNIAILEDETYGEWTLVYDEGLLINIAGRTFILFFKYSPLSSSSDFTKVEDFQSICSETYIGWWHNAEKEWGCVIGKQNSPKNDVRKSSIKSDASVLSPNALPQLRGDYLSVRQHKERTPELTKVSTERLLSDFDTNLFTPDIEFIQLVNNNKESSWRAKEYDFMSMLTNDDIDKRLGRKKLFVNRPKAKIETPSCSETDLSQYPIEVDWTTIDNGRYRTGTKDQGGCGSCYAQAFLDALNIRVRIATRGAVLTQYSAEYATSCSTYNQGCNGGFPLLVASHGSVYGFVPESCSSRSRYSIGQCFSIEESCLEKAIFLESYSYVGGYYGACSEESLVKELQKGPIPVAFEAPSSLSYYEGGIFDGSLSKDQFDYDGFSRWEKTNHAVVMVGYGYDEVSGINWGPYWGEDGYFRMKRGCDPLSVESMGVSFDLKDFHIEDDQASKILSSSSS